MMNVTDDHSGKTSTFYVRKHFECIMKIEREFFQELKSQKPIHFGLKMSLSRFFHRKKG